MDIIGVIVACVLCYCVFVLVTTGKLTFHLGHMNWVGIVVHSLFVGALLFLVVKLFSKNPAMAKEWGLVGMGCIIGWNLLIATGVV